MIYKALIFTLILLNTCGLFAKNGITARFISLDASADNQTQPQFSGGEDLLYDYLQTHIRYPYLLIKIGMEGDVELMFTVTKEGKIKDIEITRGFDPLADEEVLRVIKNMPDWQPAMLDGNAVDARQRLAVNFTLNDELVQLAEQVKDKADKNTYIEHPLTAEKRKALWGEPDTDEPDIIVPDTVAAYADPSLNRTPEFPGGQEALDEYLQTNMKYPKKAIQYGIEGRTIFNLEISPEGEISKIWIYKGLFPDCDEEAFYLIKKMPRWIPGLKYGKAVAMKVILPIPFILPK